MTELNQMPACSKPLLSPVRVINGDCLEIMKSIPDCSIDMVFADLPYQMTANKWDCLIDAKQLFNDEIKNVYPARVKFRCFDNESTDDAYRKLSQYMEDNATKLNEETKL